MRIVKRLYSRAVLGIKMKSKLITIIASLVIIWSCVPESTNLSSKVEVKKHEGEYGLYVNDKPYRVKGAGINYPDGHNFEALKKAGGNTFRTWSTKYATQELAAAKKFDLMILMGIDLKKELHGFDYNDEDAVAKQLSSVKQQILRYKDHPNILGWIVANEPNLLFAQDGSLKLVNPKVYQAISDIIDFIHEVSPNHLVTYSFAGIIKEHIDIAMQYTPQVDFLSVQVYNDLTTMQSSLSQLNIDKPFMVTEFGPKGHWETPATSWGREIEELSGEKAKTFAQRIQLGIANNSSQKLIGHFAFEWGQKQERTPTWYGMFNKDGRANARIDELTKFWTGKYPINRAPIATSILINNQLATSSLIVAPDQYLEASVEYSDPNNDVLTVKWQLLKEVSNKSQGGAYELEPSTVDITILENTTSSLDSPNSVKSYKNIIRIKSPSDAGEYRLFSYIYDNKLKVGNANYPFLVK